MHSAQRHIRTMRGVGSAIVAAAVVATLAVPSAAMASGSAPTVPDVHVTTAEDTPVSGNLITDATDPENDTLTVFFDSVQPALGTLTVTPSNGDFTFTPAANKSGSASVLFYVGDGTTWVAATLYVTVTAVNDAPVCASPVTSSGDEDAEQSGSLSCTDVDSASLTYARVGQASHGAATVDPDGSWTYTPDANYNGTDSFTFRANDGDLNSNTATVNLTINPVNDAPVCATPVTSIGGRGRQQSGTLHCTDVDSPSLSYALDTQASNGTATVDPDGSWTYTPESDTFTGSDSFTFTANDGSLDSDAATMDVTVSPDTTAPVVQKPSLLLTTAAVNESASIQISWSATDDDTGVAGYEVQAKVGSGAWTTIYTGTGTSITKSYHLNSSLTWRVRATDRADNTSAWVATPVHRLSAYQETSSSISYTGTWSYRKASASSGTGYKYDTASGKYAQLKFTGMQVLYVAPKLSTAGYVKVYVNGVYKGRKSLHRSSTAYGQVIYRATWSTSATRTIRIVNAQSGKKTTLDAFIVLR